jgi:hypothetical protein
MFSHVPVAQLEEHLPSKQVVASSSLARHTFFADVAQPVEQLSCNQQVVCSSQTVSFLNGSVA